jgi:hypothetical protein
MVSEGNFEDQNVHFKNVYCWKIYNLFVQALETGIDYKAVILQINTKLEKPESDAQVYSGTHIIQVKNNNI